MSVPLRYILHQGATIGGMARLAFASATAPLRRDKATGIPDSHPRATKRISPPSRDLVRFYLEDIGGELSVYWGQLPPHLFSQWSYDLVARTMEHLPYPMHALLNGGCRLEMHRSLEATELQIEARLEEIDESPSRVRIHQIVETGPVGASPALTAHMYFVLPRSSTEPGDRERSRPRVREDAHEIERWSLSEDAGWNYAKLTGDFNPIHWCRPAARAAGFDHTILHGFSTMARAMEGLNTTWFGGRTPIEVFDVRFTRPLALPADVGLYVTGASGPDDDDPAPVEVAVGDGSGEPAYMIGECQWDGSIASEL